MAGSERRYSSSRDERVRSRDGKNSGQCDRDRDRHSEYRSHRDQSDHHTKRERTSQHEQSSISKSHGLFKYSEYEMVTKIESERETRRRLSDHTTKREQRSPKREMGKQLPVSISSKVSAIEREDKVRRTGWDQPPESNSLHAEKNTVSKEAATTDLTSEKPTVAEEVATKNVILTDMFDPKIEEQSELYLDIRDEVQEECSKIGAVVDAIHVDRKSGLVCIRFDNNRSAALAKKKFHGWVRHGESIKATYLEEERYTKRYAR